MSLELSLKPEGFYVCELWTNLLPTAAKPWPASQKNFLYNSDLRVPLKILLKRKRKFHLLFLGRVPPYKRCGRNARRIFEFWRKVSPLI